jgi:hypothetical protein
VFHRLVVCRLYIVTGLDGEIIQIRRTEFIVDFLILPTYFPSIIKRISVMLGRSPTISRRAVPPGPIGIERMMRPLRTLLLRSLESDKSLELSEKKRN